MDSSVEVTLAELKNVGLASLTLSLMKQTKFDEQTVSSLKDLKERREVLEEHNLDGAQVVVHREGNIALNTELQQNNGNPNPTMLLRSQQEQVPRMRQITELYVPPEIPPIPSLRDVFLTCRRSRPFERQLTESDVRDGLCRLSIAKKHAQNFVLPMLNPDENLQNGVGVTIYDINGSTFNMILRIWASKFYVLTGGWNSFKKAHGLQELRDFVTLWTFRHSSTGKLCFAIMHRSSPLSQTPTRRTRRSKRLKEN
ncbi:hypothetical protein K2173_015999 [Erythroxylum novogranatense]|uniref:TF-B3 domain-containing protein n=1 Tax=Erythroxylum novogranatense TaxID=1862640 RepID=A0AAV8SFI9_9ROSI|nr:hypothetical protein K2173_015999 [Erythroxylum novogranatense]